MWKAFKESLKNTWQLASLKPIYKHLTPKQRMVTLSPTLLLTAVQQFLMANALFSLSQLTEEEPSFYGIDVSPSTVPYICSTLFAVTAILPSLSSLLRNQMRNQLTTKIVRDVVEQVNKLPYKDVLGNKSKIEKSLAKVGDFAESVPLIIDGIYSHWAYLAFSTQLMFEHYSIKESSFFIGESILKSFINFAIYRATHSRDYRKKATHEFKAFSNHFSSMLSHLHLVESFSKKMAETRIGRSIIQQTDNYFQAENKRESIAKIIIIFTSLMFDYLLINLINLKNDEELKSSELIFLLSVFSGVNYNIVEFVSTLYKAEPLLKVSQKVQSTLALSSSETNSKSAPDLEWREQVRNHLTLEFKNVYFRYGHGPYVLENVSFKINSPYAYALVGKSGAGKTTILNLILGFYQPDSGFIYINNKEIREINKEDLQSIIAYLPQQQLHFEEYHPIINLFWGTTNEFYQEFLIKMLADKNFLNEILKEVSPKMHKRVDIPLDDENTHEGFELREYISEPPSPMRNRFYPAAMSYRHQLPHSKHTSESLNEEKTHDLPLSVLITQSEMPSQQSHHGDWLIASHRASPRAEERHHLIEHHTEAQKKEIFLNMYSNALRHVGLSYLLPNDPAYRRVKATQDLTSADKQKLALARLLLKENPALLILDEPGGTLDNLGALQITQKAEGARAYLNAASIRVTHHLVTVKEMNETVLVLKKGEIVQTGRAEDLEKIEDGEYTELLHPSLHRP